MEPSADAARYFSISELSKTADRDSAMAAAHHTAQEAQEARDSVEVSLMNSLPFSLSTHLSAHVSSKIQDVGFR